LLSQSLEQNSRFWKKPLENFFELVTLRRRTHQEIPT